MSRALRGDFERLRERGVAATLAPGDEPRLEPETGAPPPVDSSPAAPAIDALDALSATEDVASAVVEAQRPGWLGRLFGL